jgi:hypothetical protein
MIKFQREGKDRFNEDHGLVFRSFIYLFDELKARSEDATFVIKASYLEIYNEKVRSVYAIFAHNIDIKRYCDKAKIFSDNDQPR